MLCTKRKLIEIERIVARKVEKMRVLRLCPSLSQSPQASWSAGGRRERLWDTGIVTTGILRLTLLSFVTVNSESKNEFFFHYPRVSPGDHPLTK